LPGAQGLYIDVFDHQHHDQHETGDH